MVNPSLFYLELLAVFSNSSKDLIYFAGDFIGNDQIVLLIVA
jgi:hypothetical protein